MERKLALFGLSAIAIFIASYMLPNPIGFNPEFRGTIAEKILITYVLLGGVVPWIYLLEATRKKTSKKKFVIYFLGSWLLAPYFLLKMTGKSSEK